MLEAWSFGMASLATIATAMSPAVDDLCFAADTRMYQANDMLYFMGGPYLFAGDTDWSYSTHLYAIPLNQTLPTTSILAATNYLSIPIGGSGALELYEGGFFVDPQETTLYSFAGFDVDSNQGTATSQMLAFDIESETWSNIAVSGGALNFGSRIGGMSAHSVNFSFFSSGLPPPSSNWIPGMVRFDGSDPSNLRWSNETSNHPPNLLAGSLEFMPYGEAGSLISFGGLDQDKPGNDIFGLTYNDFSQIDVYDIASATWFHVTAVGTIPPKRFAHCTAVSIAPDASSVQITISGGSDANDFDLADIWVLTIPSFTWINVTDTSSIEYSLSPGQHVGRQAHKCKVVNGRTMLSFGGFLYFDTTRVNQYVCNASWPILRALDTSTYKWLDEYTPDIGDYHVPDAVVSVIGGNGKGHATVTAPSAGFTDEALYQIFAKKITVESTAITTGSLSATSSRSSTSPSTALPSQASTSPSTAAPSQSGTSPSPKPSHTGAIAGGAAGGGVALILAAVLIYLILPHRRKSPPEPPPQLDGPQETHGAHFGFDRNGKPLRQAELESPPPPAEVDGGWRGHQLASGGRRELRGQEFRRNELPA